MALAIDMREATAAPALNSTATLSRGIRRILLANTVTLFTLMLVIAYRMPLGVVTRVDT
jgi:hypothetical protein